LLPLDAPLQEWVHAVGGRRCVLSSGVVRIAFHLWMFIRSAHLSQTIYRINSSIAS